MSAQHTGKKNHGRLYRTLVSVKTSLVFFAVFGVLFFLGTVFPQSNDPDRLERYREAGGKLVAVVDALDLLNIFRSQYFGFIVLLFVLHLLLCAIHRLGTLRRRSPIGQFSRKDLLKRDHSFSVVRPAGADLLDVEKVLKRLGFRRRKYYSEDARVKRIVCEKGLSFRWLSWAYHACFLLAIIGFGVTYLFAFEGYLTIGVGERVSVPSIGADTNWQRLMRLLDREDKPYSRKIELKLERFITQYTEKAKLTYPDAPTGRLRATWGFGQKPVAYEMPENSLYPRDWFSLLRVYEEGAFVMKRRIEVNDPLRHAGLTFYQIGYDYEFDLNVGGETITGIKAEAPFTIPQMEGEFRIGYPRLGSLFRYDGTVETLTPSATLRHRPPAEREKPRWTTVGDMPIGVSTEIMHAQIKLANLRESSVVSYRYDPGVPLLWVAGMGLVSLMAARIYLPWYQLRCHVDDAQGRTQVTVGLRMIGLFARPERLQQKLSEDFLSERRAGPGKR